MQVKKQQLESDMEERTGPKLGKEYVKAVYRHCAYLTYMQSTSCEMPGWMNHKLESRFWEKYQPQICRWYQSNGRKRRGIKKPLDDSKRGEWKSWLKAKHSKSSDHGIWSHHFMANRRRKVEAVTDFLFLGSKITADSDCSHEIKRQLLLGRRAMTNLDSILKSRNITFLTEV